MIKRAVMGYHKLLLKHWASSSMALHVSNGDKIFHWMWSSMTRLGCWPVSEGQASACLCFPSAGFQPSTPVLTFKMWVVVTLCLLFVLLQQTPYQQSHFSTPRLAFGGCMYGQLSVQWGSVFQLSDSILFVFKRAALWPPSFLINL